MTHLRILVVEDDGIVAFLLGQLLEDMGHEVCAIESCEADGIAAAKRLRPDLMIVDEHLGRESGLAVIEAVLRDVAMPFIFVSGDTAKVRAAMPLAITLEKPYFATDLERAITDAVAQVVEGAGVGQRLAPSGAAASTEAPQVAPLSNESAGV